MKKCSLLILGIFLFTSIFAQEKGKLKNSKDGKTYQTVTVGTQTWLAENYNYNTPTGSNCYWDDEDFCKKYGKLYTCKTAHEHRPEGWRIPEIKDLESLSAHFGGNMEPLFFEYDEGELTHGGWEIQGVYEKLVSTLELKPGGLINFEYEVDINNIGYYWLLDSEQPENIMYLLIVDFVNKTITISFVDWSVEENDFMFASIRFIKE